MSPDDERFLIEALRVINPTDTTETLRAESVDMLKRLLACSDNQAAEVLADLEAREVIAANLTPPGGPVHGRTIPTAKLSWRLLTKSGKKSK